MGDANSCCDCERAVVKHFGRYFRELLDYFGCVYVASGSASL